MLKLKVMKVYREIIKKGDYTTAREVLSLLINKELTVSGYSDIAYNIESSLDKIIKPIYSCDYRKVTFYMNEKFLVKEAK